MKVLLKQDVDNLGYAGEIFKVSPGYGRNYLIPRGLAVLATDGALKQAKSWMEQAAARREQLRKENAALAERLSDTTITFLAKAGETGKLYGSITTSDIAERLEKEVGIEVDRRKIGTKPLRQLGTHTVDIRLDSEFTGRLKVSVQAEDSDEGDVAEEVEEVVEAVEPVEETAVEEADIAEEAVEA